MNPFYQALMGRGASAPAAAPSAPASAPAPTNMGGGPFGAMNGIMQRAQQLASSFQNPQQLVQRYFPDAPAEVSRDPDQMIGWLQQTGRVNPQMVQMARNMMGM